jgi:hypothetical protein
MLILKLWCILQRITNYGVMLPFNGITFPPKIVNISKVVADLTWMDTGPYSEYMAFVSPKFIATSVTFSLNHNQYSAIADLHNLQFTVTHALGFSVFSSRTLVTEIKLSHCD